MNNSGNSVIDTILEKEHQSQQKLLHEKQKIKLIYKSKRTELIKKYEGLKNQKIKEINERIKIIRESDLKELKEMELFFENELSGLDAKFEKNKDRGLEIIDEILRWCFSY